MPPRKDNKHNKGRNDNRTPRKSATQEKEERIEAWKPKTVLGQKVKEGLVTDIDEIFNSSEQILEAEIVDVVLPDMETDLLLIGQAKGKFGGGKRRIFRQTQKKTKEGNKIHFMTCGLVGNKNGYLGLAVGKSKETVPARDKSIRNAKLSLIKIRRGCGCWECNCGEPHSIPFSIEGKCGSSIIRLIPAPKGKGLCIEKECAKILKMAGIKDVWCKTKGQTKTKLNLIKALMKALANLTEMKVQPTNQHKLGLIEGKLKGTISEEQFLEVAGEKIEEEQEPGKEKTEKSPKVE